MNTLTRYMAVIGIRYSQDSAPRQVARHTMRNNPCQLARQKHAQGLHRSSLTRYTPELSRQYLAQAREIRTLTPFYLP